jgi:ABC-type transport system substrate-binding protein
MIGSGPYLLDKYLKGKQFTLKKNPTWWGLNVEKNKATWLIPTIVLKFVQDPNVSLEMLKKGDIDFMGFTPEIYVKKTEGEMWGRDVFKVKTTNQSPKGYSFIGWNFKHPILKDRLVRKALYHLVNRPLMIEKFEYGLSTQATGPVYPGSVYADPSIKPVEFNPELALKTLREAGWKDTDGDGIRDKVLGGKKTTLELQYKYNSGNDTRKNIGLIYKENLKKIFVKGLTSQTYRGTNPSKTDFQYVNQSFDENQIGFNTFNRKPEFIQIAVNSFKQMKQQSSLRRFLDLDFSESEVEDQVDRMIK